MDSSRTKILKEKFKKIMKTRFNKIRKEQNVVYVIEVIFHGGARLSSLSVD